MVCWRGTSSQWLKELHEYYSSDIVRISPKELSLISPSAWKDIHGQRPNHAGFPRYPVAFISKDAILTAGDADHSRMRRLLSHAFSEKALREQESLIRKYVEKLIQGLKNRIAPSSKGEVNVVDWYNWAAFDVIGDLAFGYSFDCLTDARYTPRVARSMQGFKALAQIQVTARFPLFGKVLKLFVPKRVVKDAIEHRTFAIERVEQRMRSEVQKPDFLSYILAHNKEKEGNVKGRNSPQYKYLHYCGQPDECYFS